LGVKFAENDDAIKKNKLYQALNQSQAQKSSDQQAGKVTGELVPAHADGVETKAKHWRRRKRFFDCEIKGICYFEIF
jgi:hypothetical protein